jgi:predicted RNA-binding Zn ribbon-like protein
MFFSPWSAELVPEPVAIEFANTRSSSARDRIATLPAWRKWIEEWPGLGSVGRAVDAEGLLELRSLRDDVQILLRAAAERRGFDARGAARLLELARLPSCMDVSWAPGRVRLVSPPGATPATMIAQHLAGSALDLLVTGPPLAVCEGRDCLKLFVASRPQRRWCDSAVCGNRARVAAFGRRRRNFRIAPRNRPSQLE